MRKIGDKIAGSGPASTTSTESTSETEVIKSSEQSSSTAGIETEGVGKKFEKQLTDEGIALRKHQKKASGMIKQAAVLGLASDIKKAGLRDAPDISANKEIVPDRGTISDERVLLSKSQELELRDRQAPIFGSTADVKKSVLHDAPDISARKEIIPDHGTIGDESVLLSKSQELAFKKDMIQQDSVSDEKKFDSLAPKRFSQDDSTAVNFEKKSSDDAISLRKSQKKVSGMIKQAALLGKVPSEKKAESPREKDTTLEDWVMVPEKGADPEAPSVRMHKKIEIKEDYDPRAKRPTIKRIKADEFFAKRPAGRPRAMGHKEETLPEMALDKRAPVNKAKVGERPTPDSVPTQTTFSSLFYDKNIHLKDYFRHSQEPIASTKKGVEDQFRKLDESLAKCEAEFGETVTNERMLLKETMKDTTLMSSAGISSPAHAIELKRLGLQPSVAGKVGKFTDVHLQEEMTKLGGGAVNTVYAGKYMLPDGKGAFEGVYKPEIGEWKKGVDDIPMAAYEIGLDIKNPRLAYRNVATTRLDQLLGFGLTTRTEMAIHHGRLGTVSERAPGVSPQGPTLQGTEEHTARDINYSDPRLRRDLVRLQFMDCIAGQVDRHHGNYFVRQDAKGACHGVMGIDNDLSWGKKLTDFKTMGSESMYGNPIKLPKHLPPVIDSEAYSAIMKLSPRTFAERMGGLLTSDEISAAGKRLSIVQEHLTKLEKRGDVLDKLEHWKGDAIGKRLAEKEKDEFVTYVGRDADVQEHKRKNGLLVPYPVKK